MIPFSRASRRPALLAQLCLVPARRIPFGLGRPLLLGVGAAILTLPMSLLAAAPAPADTPGQFGQVASFGGFDESAYNNGSYGGTLTPGKFLDIKGFAVDTQDSEGGSQDTALYVADRTSSAIVANTSWRIQKLDQSGNVLGTTTFNLPNGKFNAAAIAGLTVDHTAGRLYALVMGQPSTSAQVPVAQELLAWAITPNGGKELVAATGSGLASDPLQTTGALVSSRSQLQPGGGTPLYGPEGIAIDPHTTGGATDPIVIEASELSNGIGKGSPIPGDTIVQQVATSPQSGKDTGDLLGSWTDASVPGAAALDHYGPAGISTNPDGTLTVLLEADTSLSAGNVNVLKLNADLSNPAVVSEPAQRPAVIDLDQAPFYTDVPPFSTLPSGIALASGAGSPLVQLSTPASSSAGGLYAAIFQPSHDNVDYQFGGEQPGPFYWHDAGSDQSPAWSANIGVRLLSPTAGGAISEPNGATIVNTLGARSGACGIDAPYAALAAGNNGALWVLDSGEQTVNAGALGGGRRIVELQSGASSSLCPQPSGTFTVSANGTSQLASATPSLTVAAGTKVTFDAGDALATAGGMNAQGGTPYAFEWDVNGNATDGPNGDGFETINQMQAPAYTFPTPKTSYEYTTPGVYHVRLKLVRRLRQLPDVGHRGGCGRRTPQRRLRGHHRQPRGWAGGRLRRLRLLGGDGRRDHDLPLELGRWHQRRRKRTADHARLREPWRLSGHVDGYEQLARN